LGQQIFKKTAPPPSGHCQEKREGAKQYFGSRWAHNRKTGDGGGPNTSLRLPMIYRCLPSGSGICCLMVNMTTHDRWTQGIRVRTQHWVSAPFKFLKQHKSSHGGGGGGEEILLLLPFWGRRGGRNAVSSVPRVLQPSSHIYTHQLGGRKATTPVSR